MRVLGRGAAIAAWFVILSSQPVLQRLVGGDPRAYVLGTVALALVVSVVFLRTIGLICAGHHASPLRAWRFASSSRP
jgi:hypothetical protein